jgi:hypothetical protein
MAVVTNVEMFDILMAVEGMRNSARNLEFSRIGMADVRREALKALGDPTVKRDLSDPASALDRLTVLEKRVNEAVAAASMRKF